MIKKRSYTKKELHILEYAAQEFSLQGYTAASTNSIAKNATVAKGLIFHYFESKETLYISLLEYAFDKMKTSVDAKIKTLSTYMDAFAVIQALIIVRAEFTLEEPLLSHLLYNAFHSELKLPLNLTIKVQELKKRVDDIFHPFLDGLFLHDDLVPPLHYDDQIFYKIMVMMESAFNYEKEQLIRNNAFESLNQISLQDYENMIKQGLFRNSNNYPSASQPTQQFE